MSMTNISLNLSPQTRRRLQRLADYPGSATSPSEQAIRSINEFRSTPRW